MTLFAARINLGRLFDDHGALATAAFMLCFLIAVVINIQIIKGLTRDRSKRSPARAFQTVAATTLVGVLAAGVVYAISCWERGAPENMIPQFVLIGLCVLMGIGGYANAKEEEKPAEKHWTQTDEFRQTIERFAAAKESEQQRKDESSKGMK